jgi:CheY-like chemotaxis protein
VETVMTTVRKAEKGVVKSTRLGIVQGGAAFDFASLAYGSWMGEPISRLGGSKVRIYSGLSIFQLFRMLHRKALATRPSSQDAWLTRTEALYLGSQLDSWLESGSPGNGARHHEMRRPTGPAKSVFNAVAGKAAALWKVAAPRKMNCNWPDKNQGFAAHIAFHPESATESEVPCCQKQRLFTAANDTLNAKKVPVKTRAPVRRIPSTRTRRSKRTASEVQMSRMPVAKAELGCAMMEASVTRDTESETVLLVVADPLLRGVLTQVLTQLGYRVLNAATGVSAQQMAREKKRIDLLLAEFSSLTTSGLELVRWFCLNRTETKVLVASDALWDIEACLGDLPRLAVLAMPFTPSELARMVRTILK